MFMPKPCLPSPRASGDATESWEERGEERGMSVPRSRLGDWRPGLTSKTICSEVGVGIHGKAEPRVRFYRNAEIVQKGCAGDGMWLDNLLQ